MIRIGEKKTTRMDTGKNIDRTAETFTESGPNDELKTVDAYDGEIEASSPSDLLDEGADGDLMGKLKSFLSVPDGVSATTPSLGGEISNTLWKSLICGMLDPIDFKAPKLGKMFDISLWLRSTNCGISALLKLLKFDSGGVGLNKEELNRRLRGAMDHSLLSLSNANQDSLINQAASLYTGKGGDQNKFVSVVNGIRSRMDGGTINVSSLNDLIAAIPGASDAIEVLDIEAETMLLGSFLQQLGNSGIPQAGLALLNQINDKDVKERVLLSELEYFARTTQLDKVRLTIDTVGQARSLAKVPNLVELILENYNLSRMVPRSDYPAKLSELTGTLDKINPRWYQTQRNGVWVSSLGPFQSTSLMGRTLLMESPYRKYVMMGRKYTQRNIWLVAKQYHPKVVRSQIT